MLASTVKKFPTLIRDVELQVNETVIIISFVAFECGVTVRNNNSSHMVIHGCIPLLLM